MEIKLFLILVSSFAFQLGLCSINNEQDLLNFLTKDQFAEEKDMIAEILEEVDSDHIRSYLKELTSEPHIAGHRRDDELTQWIKKSWEDNGLDYVELATYDFYLSWPNKVTILCNDN